VTNNFEDIQHNAAKINCGKPYKREQSQSEEVEKKQSLNCEENATMSSSLDAEIVPKVVGAETTADRTESTAKRSLQSMTSSHNRHVNGSVIRDAPSGQVTLG
jgi:hypothetical protein